MQISIVPVQPLNSLLIFYFPAGNLHIQHIIIGIQIKEQKELRFL